MYIHADKNSRTWRKRNQSQQNKIFRINWTVGKECKQVLNICAVNCNRYYSYLTWHKRSFIELYIQLKSIVCPHDESSSFYILMNRWQKLRSWLVNHIFNYDFIHKKIPGFFRFTNNSFCKCCASESRFCKNSILPMFVSSASLRQRTLISVWIILGMMLNPTQ